MERVKILMLLVLLGIFVYMMLFSSLVESVRDFRMIMPSVYASYRPDVGTMAQSTTAKPVRFEKKVKSALFLTNAASQSKREPHVILPLSWKQSAIDVRPAITLIKENRQTTVQESGGASEASVVRNSQQPTAPSLDSSSNTTPANNISDVDASGKSPQLKYILYWNEFYGSNVFAWGAGQQPFIDNGCEVNTCFGTDNRTLRRIEDYDAILYHVQTLPFLDWPRRRLPHQRYVFVSRESAQYLTIPLKFYRNLFNVTLTYRRDSDFPYLYGKFVPVVPAPPPSPVITNYASGKSKLVAWFVSHCSSRSYREAYVRALRRHIPVDIYGECGTLKCPRSDNLTCHKTLLNRDYKFYLSFENSLCNDYVTEKLFDALSYDVVPIVWGSANYSIYAPPGSYIDATQYAPRNLARYLKTLDQNDAMYNEFFTWKGRYGTMSEGYYFRSAFCSLCKYLHGTETKVYRDINAWWTYRQCRQPKIQK